MKFDKLSDWEGLNEDEYFLEDVLLETVFGKNLKIGFQVHNSQLLIEIMGDKFLKVESGR